MSQKKQSIGHVLKTAREEKNLSLDEISVLTRVKLKYLIAIEADNFEILPSTVQKKGFIRTYARALDLDPAPLIAELRQIINEPTPEETQSDSEEHLVRDPVTPTQSLVEIGDVLKTQRERLGFNLTNIENQIFIPERYLQAIENGHLEELPSTVQGRGMVKNYAQFLGLDPDPLLLSYADVLQSRMETVRVQQPQARRGFPPLIWIRRYLATPTIFWAVVVSLIVAVSIWSGVLIFGTRGSLPGEIEETIPAVADILLPTATATETPEPPVPTQEEFEVEVDTTTGIEDPPENNQNPTATPGLTGNEKVQVQLIITQRTWVRVTVDNILAFEGRLVPGSVKLFGGELSIEVLTGNAAGVEVIFNQRDLGVMGLYGEVIDRVYTAEGIATPTPTISATPTPSDTPEASPTPTPSSTPEPE
jgi:cytoskeletal protein RodZ